MRDNPGGQQPRDLAQQPLPARSAAETQLYLDLHPCACGTTRPRIRQELREGHGGSLTSLYDGVCPRCGSQWTAAFSLPAVPPLAGSIGGAEPSAIIDPGEWLWISDQAAGVPASVGPLSPRDRARLLLAADALDEAAKFIPPGHDRVPRGALTSSVGRAMYDAFPWRFLEADLSCRAQLYRAGACLTLMADPAPARH
jgi:hypothetical protein